MMNYIALGTATCLLVACNGQTRIMAAQFTPTGYDTWSCEQLVAESERIEISIDLLRKAQRVSPKGGYEGGERPTDANEAMVNRDSLASRIARFEEQRDAIGDARRRKGCR
jgi:hypothetical protein